MKKQQLSWWLWAIGTVLIVLSWMNVVTPTVGYYGFGCALAGSILGWGMRPPR